MKKIIAIALILIAQQCYAAKVIFFYNSRETIRLGHSTSNPASTDTYSSGTYGFYTQRTATSNFTARSIWAYLKGSGWENAFCLTGGVYSDDGADAPDAKLGQTSEYEPPDVIHYRCMQLSSPLFVAAGTKYWIGYNTESGYGVQYGYDAGPVNKFKSTSTACPTLPDTFAGSAVSDGDDGVYLSSEACPSYPGISSASIASDGVTLTVNFSEAVSHGSGWGASDFYTNCSYAGNIALTYSSGDGTSAHVFTTAETVESYYLCTLYFTGGADSVEDNEGNDLEKINSDPITNNSTQ